MRLLERSIVRKNHRSKWAALPLAAAVMLVLAGCTAQELNGFMPGAPGTSDLGDYIATFWVNSWVVLMVIGFITWGLIIWASVVYRRRKNETGMPHQLRYHMPIEIMFTIIPVILVFGFFAFTARDQAIAEENFAEDQIDVHVEVYGKQWSWDFNYLEVPGSEYAGNVYSQGVQAAELRDENGDKTGDIANDSLPVLYLPVGANVTIDLKSRDVAHSFWIPEFHYKEDTIPGKTNTFSFVPTQEGVFIGKCAELCGEFHSLMLLEVHVVSAEEYAQHIADLEAAGQTGAVGDEFNRNDQNPGTKVPVIDHENAEH